MRLRPGPGDHRDQVPKAGISHRKRIRYQRSPPMKHTCMFGVRPCVTYTCMLNTRTCKVRVNTHDLATTTMTSTIVMRMTATVLPMIIIVSDEWPAGRHKVPVTATPPVRLFVILCSPPGSSVRGVLQARVLEWVSSSSSRGSS